MNENDEEIHRILIGTVDPTVMLHDGPVPAMSTLLYRVCDGDAKKFDEATRLIGLFVGNALSHGR